MASLKIFIFSIDAFRLEFILNFKKVFYLRALKDIKSTEIYHFFNDIRTTNNNEYSIIICLEYFFWQQSYFFKEDLFKRCFTLSGILQHHKISIAHDMATMKQYEYMSVQKTCHNMHGAGSEFKGKRSFPIC